MNEDILFWTPDDEYQDFIAGIHELTDDTYDPIDVKDPYNV